MVVGWSFSFCGCRQQKERDIAVECARARFRQLYESMNNGCVGITNLSAIGGQINNWISVVSNASRRTELAYELSDIVLSVDLTNQPYTAVFPNGTRYSPRDSSTIFYPEFINATCWIMEDYGCSPRTVFEFFFQALKKYKDASFSIPLGLKPMPGESHETSSARYTCARGAYTFYAETMDQIRRSLLSNRPSIFYVPPPELQDEFIRRLKPFYDIPDKEEFYNYLLPGIKRKTPLPVPSARKMPGSKGSDADIIEVDI